LLSKIKHGIFWGHFNPPTKAHKAIITSALNHYNFEELLVIINHEEQKDAESPYHRLQMLKSMFDKTPFENKVKLHLQDNQNNYSYFSLRDRLKTPLAAIVGYDSFLAWQNNPNSPFERGPYDLIIVVSRHGQRLSTVYPNIVELAIEPAYKEVSSTQVRKYFTQDPKHQQLHQFLDDQVLSYICQNQLYVG